MTKTEFEEIMEWYEFDTFCADNGFDDIIDDDKESKGKECEPVMHWRQ